MKRVAVLLLLVTACAGIPKGTEARMEKCADSPDLSWQYSYTYEWTTQEAVYGAKTSIDYQSGELKTEYGITGYKTVHHSRDIYDCLPRR